MSSTGENTLQGQGAPSTPQAEQPRQDPPRSGRGYQRDTERLVVPDSLARTLGFNRAGSVQARVDSNSKREPKPREFLPSSMLYNATNARMPSPAPRGRARSRSSSPKSRSPSPKRANKSRGSSPSRSPRVVAGVTPAQLHNSLNALQEGIMEEIKKLMPPPAPVVREVPVIPLPKTTSTAIIDLILRDRDALTRAANQNSQVAAILERNQPGPSRSDPIPPPSVPPPSIPAPSSAPSAVPLPMRRRHSQILGGTSEQAASIMQRRLSASSTSATPNAAQIPPAQQEESVHVGFGRVVDLEQALIRRKERDAAEERELLEKQRKEGERKENERKENERKENERKENERKENERKENERKENERKENEPKENERKENKRKAAKKAPAANDKGNDSSDSDSSVISRAQSISDYMKKIPSGDLRRTEELQSTQPTSVARTPNAPPLDAAKLAVAGLFATPAGQDQTPGMILNENYFYNNEFKAFRDTIGENRFAQAFINYIHEGVVAKIKKDAPDSLESFHNDFAGAPKPTQYDKFIYRKQYTNYAEKYPILRDWEVQKEIVNKAMAKLTHRKTWDNESDEESDSEAPPQKQAKSVDKAPPRVPAKSVDKAQSDNESGSGSGSESGSGSGSESGSGSDNESGSESGSDDENNKKPQANAESSSEEETPEERKKREKREQSKVTRKIREEKIQKLWLEKINEYLIAHGKEPWQQLRKVNGKAKDPMYKIIPKPKGIGRQTKEKDSKAKAASPAAKDTPTNLTKGTRPLDLFGKAPAAAGKRRRSPSPQRNGGANFDTSSDDETPQPTQDQVYTSLLNMVIHYTHVIAGEVLGIYKMTDDQFSSCLPRLESVLRALYETNEKLIFCKVEDGDVSRTVKAIKNLFPDQVFWRDICEKFPFKPMYTNDFPREFEWVEFASIIKDDRFDELKEDVCKRLKRYMNSSPVSKETPRVEELTDRLCKKIMASTCIPDMMTTFMQNAHLAGVSMYLILPLLQKAWKKMGWNMQTRDDTFAGRNDAQATACVVFVKKFMDWLENTSKFSPLHLGPLSPSGGASAAGSSKQTNGVPKTPKSVDGTPKGKKQRAVVPGLVFDTDLENKIGLPETAIQDNWDVIVMAFEFYLYDNVRNKKKLLPDIPQKISDLNACKTLAHLDQKWTDMCDLFAIKRTGLRDLITFASMQQDKLPGKIFDKKVELGLVSPPSERRRSAVTGQ